MIIHAVALLMSAAYAANCSPSEIDALLGNGAQPDTQEQQEATND